VDLKDNVSSAALSFALNQGGGFKVSTTVLLTTEEIDQACKKASIVGYHPTGSR